MAQRFSIPNAQFLDGNGDPYAGGLLYFYVTGTTTALDTYSDNALTTPNANPVVADANGYFGDIFLKAQDYKVVLKTSAGVTVFTADPVHGAGVFGQQNWLKGVDVASANALTLGTDGNSFDVTGTTAITSIGTLGVGTVVILQFDGALTLTHNATDLILPGAANITTAAGDIAILYEYASGDWRMVAYQRASGLPLLMGLHTIFVPASAMKPTVSNGCASLTSAETTAGRPDMIVLDFDASSDEHAQFQVAFPASWNLGTVTFRVFWTSTATDTDGVAWGLQGVAVSDGDTIDVAYGTAVVVTDDAQSTAEDLYVTSWSSAVTIAGTPAAGDMCFFRFFRDVSDANDDMTEDARLIGVQFRYTINAGNDA